MKQNETALMMKHVDLIKRIGYDNLLNNLTDGEKNYLICTLDLAGKVRALETIAERMGV